MKLKRTTLFKNIKLQAVFIGLMALAASIGCADLAGVDAAVINGILQNVDSVSGEVTVQLKDGTTTTFNLADVDVEALQAIVGSAVLQRGDEVALTLDDDDSVTTVGSTSAKTEGTIVNIDAAAPSITIDAENGVQLKVIIEPGTEIKAKGPGPSQSNLSELVLGQEVKLNYNSDTFVASKIQFRRPGNDNDENDEDSHEDDMKGIVSIVDIDTHMITLVDDKGEEFTFAIVGSTEIDNDGPDTFASIQLGLEVEVKFDPQTMQALEIEIAEAEEAPEADEVDKADSEDGEDSEKGKDSKKDD
ncbi:MAG: hypothetical protein HQ477_03580 [Chloroflexi bacterium]|nr:hypothetical protein [Chloroflexota bacterium]